MIEKHTFGGSKASEVLAEILNTKYPRLSRRVGSFYAHFSEMMVQMMSSWRHFYTHTNGLLEVMRLYKEKKFESVKNAKFPPEVESHLLNVMSVQYRLYRKVTTNLLKNSRKEKLPKQRFHVGQHVLVMLDLKDDAGQTLISKGETVKVQNYHKSKNGCEYELPYGFYLGEKDLRRI